MPGGVREPGVDADPPRWTVSAQAPRHEHVYIARRHAVGSRDQQGDTFACSYGSFGSGAFACGYGGSGGSNTVALGYCACGTYAFGSDGADAHTNASLDHHADTRSRCYAYADCYANAYGAGAHADSFTYGSGYCASCSAHTYCL